MWKIIGVIESRSGDVQFLPEWAIGEPHLNAFHARQEAETVRAAMQEQIAKQQQERALAAPVTGGSGPAIRYVTLPAIDESLIAQLRGEAPPKPATPQLPSLSFNKPNGGQASV